MAPPENAHDLFAAIEWAQSLRPDLSESFKEEILAVPFRLVSSGYHEAAGSFRDCLFQHAESLGIDEEERSELATYFEAIEKVGPLHSRLKSHLAESPWPDLEKVEEGDSIESAEDCLDVYHDDISVELRYILRGMVRYGPQHDFMDFRWWRDASITEGAYLSLLHGARDEAWRRIELIASEDGSEEAEYPDGVGKIALAWTADTAAAERWWDAGETWWPEWESLAKRLDLEMLSEEPWEDYDPWVPVPPKQIEELTGERKRENRERRLKQALAKQAEFTRWHRDGAESLLLLLREGAQSFPDNADAFARLAGTVEEVISKVSESAKGNHQ